MTTRRFLRQTGGRNSQVFRRAAAAACGSNEGAKFRKVLVANRGEIACRIMSSLRKLGIKSVAVFSTADVSAKHVKLADEAVYIGRAPASDSYLNIPKLLEAVRKTGADAVHPGYGFLSENPGFAETLEAERIAFIGPTSKTIALMGDKLESKKLASAAGMTTIPGHDGAVLDEDGCVAAARTLGYPVMIKATAGGGGKGMRIAHDDDQAREAFVLSRDEAVSSFADGRLLVEKYLENPRHIEIQILGDKYGNAVHLHERECSVQRRNQKVIEEAPSTFLDGETRAAMGAQSVRLCQLLGYATAGTVEFLVDARRRFYFLEMNTRLQVEHPVTECVTGVDIVEQMLRLAYGERLCLVQDDVKVSGWAIEARIYAEDPRKHFGLPNVGRLHEYAEPAGVRCDSGVEEGSEIGIHYDPLISKLVSHAGTRREAIEKAVEALDRYVIRGVVHNIALVRDVLTEGRFLSGDVDTGYLGRVYPEGFRVRAASREEKTKMVAATAVLHVSKERRCREYLNGRKISIHAGDLEVWDLVVKAYGEENRVEVRRSEERFRVAVAGEVFEIPEGSAVQLQVLRRDAAGRYQIMCKGAVQDVEVRTRMAHELLRLMPEKVTRKNGSKKLKAPMSGLVRRVSCREGDVVEEGDQICVIEAMKMQNSVTAAAAGRVKAVEFVEGDAVGAGDVLIVLE